MSRLVRVWVSRIKLIVVRALREIYFCWLEAGGVNSDLRPIRVRSTTSVMKPFKNSSRR